MTPLRPASPSCEDTELWERIVDAAGTRGLTGDPLRSTMLAHSVSALCTRLAGNEDVRALAASAEVDDVETWAGVRFQGNQLGLRDPMAIVVLFLISLRTTSGATRSRFARALIEVAAQRFGVAHSSVDDEKINTTVATHGAALRQFLDAQLELTADILEDRDEVILHRAIGTTQDVDGREHDPRLHPLSSFSTNATCAVSLARHGPDAGGAGRLVLFSAVVPANRILATPATGAGAVLEREVVLCVGEDADRVAVTFPT